MVDLFTFVVNRVEDSEQLNECSVNGHILFQRMQSVSLEHAVSGAEVMKIAVLSEAGSPL